MVYVLLVLGFVLLIKGADFFVEASSSVARMLRVPSIIIGLTIVAFGTSAPELAVSTTASLAGNNEIAVGNVIGSNIFNLLVVLGACGAIHAVKVRLRWDFIASILAGAILLVMIFRDMFLSRLEAFILLGLFAVFLTLTIRDALINRVEAEEEAAVLPPLRCVVYIVGGLAAIVWGGDLVVDSASEIALNFGLSQTLVGLTVVALGTSLPELVTSVVASRKGENGLALGNVIGSNIMNILVVLALSAAVKPIPVNMFAVIDAVCLVAFSVITLILCRSRERLSRAEGLIMLGMYAGYLIYICLR
jgi:K+-dependent Na+/Ca+ exchanger related-protein